MQSACTIHQQSLQVVGWRMVAFRFSVILQPAWANHGKNGVFKVHLQFLQGHSDSTSNFCKVYYARLLWPTIGYMVNLDGFTTNPPLPNIFGKE
jgi:hypothetical protein